VIAGRTAVPASRDLQRTCQVQIPTRRGQIADRDGIPLTQVKVSHNHNLAVRFPVLFSQTDEEVLAFAKQHILSEKDILECYKRHSISRWA